MWVGIDLILFLGIDLIYDAITEADGKAEEIIMIIIARQIVICPP